MEPLKTNAEAGIIVRIAEDKDIDALFAFYRRAAAEVAKGMDCLPNGSKGSYPPEEMTIGAMRDGFAYIAVDTSGASDYEEEGIPYSPDSMRTVDGVIIGAMLSNHICNEGFRQAAWQKELPDEAVAYWHALRVLECRRGRGTARKIMGTAIRTEKEGGNAAIRFDTVTGNDNAIHLYRDLGFSVPGIYPMYEDDIGQYDSILFEMVF